MTTPTFGAVGAAAAVGTGATSINLVAPACSVGDYLIAQLIYALDAQTITASDGRWDLLVGTEEAGPQELSGYVFGLVVEAGDSGATFTFTFPTIASGAGVHGIIARFQSVNLVDPLGGITPSTNFPGIILDTVSYATLTPGSTCLVVALGFYNNDQTTAGAITGTDPALVNNWDVETLTGGDSSLFGYSGESSGIATGSRSHATTSTNDATSLGILLALFGAAAPVAAVTASVDCTDVCLVLAIEGLPARHCWPRVPAYGDANYTTTLRDAPVGVSGVWDVVQQSGSVGDWSVELQADTLWYRINPAPINFLARDVEAGTTDWVLERDHTDSGIAADDYLIVDRETVRAVGPLAAGATLRVERERYGSEAEEHSQFAAVYEIDDPPALAGRLCILYRVDGSGTAATEEVEANVLYRGRISEDPEQTQGQRVQITIAERGDQRDGKGPMMGADPELFLGDLRFDRRGRLQRVRPISDVSYRAIGQDSRRVAAPPLHHADGGYWYFPQAGLVAAIPYDGANWRGSEFDVVWGSPTHAPISEEGVEWAVDYGECYQVIWSDPQGGFAVFGADAGSGFEPSANPAVIARNLIVSKDASGGRYDRGAYLWPAYSLGVPAARIDEDSWDTAIAALAFAEATMLWLGGPKPRGIGDVIRALLAPWGYTALTTRAGRWRVARLADVYPREGAAVRATVKRSGWKSRARPLDRVILEVDPGPDGKSYSSVSVSDLTASRQYPREWGGAETLALCPYRRSDLADRTSELTIALGSRFRRLAQRTAQASADFGPSDADGLECGDALQLTDPLVRDPVTGARVSSGDTPARLISIVTDEFTGQAEAEALLLDGSARIALRCPSAQVETWTAGTFTMTVTSQLYAKRGELDAEEFVVNDAVALYTRNGAPRSDVTGAQTPPTVTSASGDTIVFSGVFKDTGGATVAPVQGDIVSYAYYPNVPLAQTTDNAWMASGGLSAPVLPTHATAAENPYLFGD